MDIFDKQHLVYLLRFTPLRLHNQIELDIILDYLHFYPSKVRHQQFLKKKKITWVAKENLKYRE